MGNEVPASMTSKLKQWAIQRGDVVVHIPTRRPRLNTAKRRDRMRLPQYRLKIVRLGAQGERISQGVLKSLILSTHLFTDLYIFV